MPRNNARRRIRLGMGSLQQDTAVVGAILPAHTLSNMAMNCLTYLIKSDSNLEQVVADDVGSKLGH